MATPIAYSFPDVGSTGVTVATGANSIYSYDILNPNAYIVYVKLYDSLVPVTLGTPAQTITVPAASGGVMGNAHSDGVSYSFTTGIAMRCVTVNINSNTNPPARPLIIELALTQASGGGTTLPSNPPSDGYLLESSAAGALSWNAPSSLVINSMVDGTDVTKKAQFDLSGITTGTTRTITVPDSNASIAPAATSAQAITNTSSTTRLSPSNLMFGMFGLSWRNVDPTSNLYWNNVATLGTGTKGGPGSNNLEVTSGATASSYESVDTNNSIAGLHLSTSSLTTGINYDKPVGFTVTIRLGSGTTNGVSRFSLGNTFATAGSGNTGKLAGKGIGIEVRNAALWAAVHDGTTFASVSLSTTLAVNGHYIVQCFRSGSGSFDYYVNGVFATTLAGGPTGTNTSHVVKCILASDNNSDAAAQDFFLTDCKIFQGL